MFKSIIRVLQSLKDLGFILLLDDVGNFSIADSNGAIFDNESDLNSLRELVLNLQIQVGLNPSSVQTYSSANPDNVFTDPTLYINSSSLDNSHATDIFDIKNSPQQLQQIYKFLNSAGLFTNPFLGFVNLSY